MNQTFELAAVLLILVLPSVISSLWGLIDRNRLMDLPHPLLNLILAWIQALGTIVLLMYLTGVTVVGLASIGVQGTQPSILGGWDLFVWAGVITVAAQIIRTIQGSAVKPDEKSPVIPWYATWFSRFDSGWSFAAYLSIVPWQVVAEELVFRGYLILLWGARTGAYELFAILSIALFVAAHLYQGRRWSDILPHLILAIVDSVVTIMYKSVIPAIGMHLLSNLMFYLRYWPDRSKWKVEGSVPLLRVPTGIYVAILGTSVVAFYSVITVWLNIAMDFNR